jgi:hypothetical protein
MSGFPTRNNTHAKASNAWYRIAASEDAAKPVYSELAERSCHPRRREQGVLAVLGHVEIG